MRINREINRSNNDKVMNIHRLYIELKETVKTGNFDQSLALFDLTYLMFDILEAVGLLTLDNFKKVVGIKDAERVWRDLI